MKSLAIIGAQWGDEGKGKITDLIAAQADYVVRYQGGNNAGHTIIVDGKKIVLHQIPSGILHPKTVSVVSHGVVFEPEAFLKEMSEVPFQVTPTQLKISTHATIITSFHKLIDAAREGATTNKIGTTGKGIGPAYEDKIARRSLKVADLLNKETILTKLKLAMEEKSFLFSGLYKMEVPTIEAEAARLYELGQKIAPFVCDTFSLLNSAREQNKKILYEGAQGILLDIDYGTYPYVTSSSTGASGIYTGVGGFNSLNEVLGITKAYITRVGSGPMPTEQLNAIGDEIQKKGNEFGATTGRRRRCGWLDIPLLKYAIKASGLTSIALTKVDVLSNLNELKVCTHYQYEGKTYQEMFPGMDLAKVTPVYKEMKPFKDDFKGDFSMELNEYLRFIESEIKIPIGIVAFGPERKEIRFLKNYL
jgi:adenylosuccinate synthase